MKLNRNVPAISIAISAACSAAASEPCETWLTFAAGVNHTVFAAAVYNGELYIGGEFTFAMGTGQILNHIARWDEPSQAWQPLVIGENIGTSDPIRALMVHEGQLIAGGSFTTAGGTTVNRIARYDGAQWTAFGPQCPGTPAEGCGMSSQVNALTVYNGQIVAAGFFSQAGGQPVNFIARWDGASWQPFTGPVNAGMNTSVNAITVHNADLVAGGLFTSAGGVTVNRIARWNGSAWQPYVVNGHVGLSGGGNVGTVAVHDGDLIAGGNFGTIGGITVNRIARWDGSTWHPFVDNGVVGLSGPLWVNVVNVYNDDLIVGGGFTQGGGRMLNSIARWTSDGWQPFIVNNVTGLGAGGVQTLHWHDDTLYIGGGFTSAGGQTVNRIIAWRDCDDTPTPGDCPADLTGDGVVGVADLLQLLAAWGPCTNPAPGACPADFTGDGNVGVADLLELLAQWGPCP